jgi:uncharacterized membrane protein
LYIFVCRCMKTTLFQRSLFILVVTVTAFITVLPTYAAERPYDVILVRADLPIDYVIAQAYAHKEGIPIITTDPLFLTETVRREFLGYRAQGAATVLIIGGADTAISADVESELLEMGFQVNRLWDWDRIGTAARVAIELWDSSEAAVIAHADVTESYLIASSISINLQAPILLTKENELPVTTIQALDALQVEKAYLVGPKISVDVENTLIEKGLEVKRVGKDIEIKEIPVIREEPLIPLVYRPIPLTVGALIGLVAGYFLFKGVKKVQKREIPIFVLDEDEQKVMEAIGEGIKQEELPDITGFSRPKITRIISELENKRIISRTKRGKTYIIKTLKSIVEE